MMLVTTWFGSFILDGDEIVESMLFPKNAKDIAARMRRMRDSRVLTEEKALAEKLDDFFVLESRLEKIGGSRIDMQMPFIQPEEYGYSRELLHDAMMVVAKEDMTKAVGRDDHVSQAINTLDDLAKTTNVLTERLKEWYGLHFPELEKMVDTNEFIHLVSEFGGKEGMPQMRDVDTIGYDLSSEDERTIKELAGLIYDLNRRKDVVEAYIEDTMKSFAPNVAEIAGPIIGARLIYLAGGLERLARLPSGTIQLLGAEKALFRHLKSKTKPPKHGVLFQHPDIHRSPYWQRGAVARAYAGKIGIAARADYYSQRFIGPELRKDLDEALERIRESKKSRPETKRRK